MNQGSDRIAYLSGRQYQTGQLAHLRLIDGNNVSVGVSAGEHVQGGVENVFVGMVAGANAVSNTSVFVGSRTGSDASQITSSVFQGYRAGERAEYITNSVYIGPYTGQQAIRSSDTVLVGYQAGANLTSGSRNVILGSYAGFSQYNGFDNVIIGHRAGYFNKLGSNNVFLGTQSGWAATDAMENVCLGVASGENLVSGRKNVLSGFRAGANIRNASNCIAMGTRAMEYFYNGDTNTCLGTEVARRFTGNNNTIVGGYSTANAFGNFNTIIGSRSMNRQTLEQVNLSNCVVLGENIQFDIPVRPVLANIGDFELVPDAYLNAPDDALVVFQDPDSSYENTSASIILNIVPVGDPMVVKERYFSFGTPDTPCLLDTSEDGVYRIRWGSAVSDTNDLLDTVPVDISLERVDATMTVRALVYGELESEWDVDASDQVSVCIEQTFDPPSIRVTIDDDTTEVSGWLPGTSLTLEPFGQSAAGAYTVYTLDDTSFIVPGQEIQIIESAISALNRVFRVIDVGTDSITFATPADITLNDIGSGAQLLASRVVSVADVEGTVEDEGVVCTVPSFASFLVGTLTDPQVYISYIDGDGGTVYDIDIVDAARGEFTVLGATEPLLGTVSLGTLEPLLIGLDISTSGPSKSVGSFGIVYNQRADTGLQTKDFEGPYPFDGHVHVGAGTQADMDVNIRSNVITFSSKGYSAAEYTVGSLNSSISIGGTFQLDYDNVNFGVKWLDTYAVTCVTDGTWFECLVSYELGSQSDLANVSTDGVRMHGDMTVYTLTRETLDDVYELVETDYPLRIGEGGVSDEVADTVEIRVDHDMKKKTLRVEVLVYTGLKILALFMDFTEVGPPNRGSRSLRYFADGQLLLTAARYTNAFYADYPTFSDCIFIGSNFTVGGNAALEERSNVCIAAIGTQRLFRGRSQLFEIFSDVVRVPTLVAGNVPSEALDVGGGGAFAAAVYKPLDGSEETLYIEGLSSTGSMRVRTDLDVGGDVQCDGTATVTGDGEVGGDMTVTGAVVAGTLEVLETTEFGGDVTVNGSMHTSDVTVDGILDVTGAVLFESDLRVDGEVGCGTLDVDANAMVGGHCEITESLVVLSVAEVDSLEVVNGVVVGGRVDVDGVISSDTDVYIQDESVTEMLGVLRTGIDDLNTDLGEVADNVSTLQDDVHDLEDNLNALDEQLYADEEGDIPILQEDVTTLQTDVSALQGDVRGLEEDFELFGKQLYDDEEGDIPRLFDDVDGKYSADGGRINGSVTVGGTLSVENVNQSIGTQVAVWDGNELRKNVGGFVTANELFNQFQDFIDNYYIPLERRVAQLELG